jgi:hypothetical protein
MKTSLKWKINLIWPYEELQIFLKNKKDSKISWDFPFKEIIDENFVPLFRPEIPESLAAMFSRKFSSFGFAAHLFQEEIRNMEGRRGSANLLDSGGMQEMVLANQAANLFFLHLLRPSRGESSSEFDRSFVRDQIREQGILEGINIR